MAPSSDMATALWEGLRILNIAVGKDLAMGLSKKHKSKGSEFREIDAYLNENYHEDLELMIDECSCWSQDARLAQFLKVFEWVRDWLYTRDDGDEGLHIRETIRQEQQGSSASSPISIDSDQRIGPVHIFDMNPAKERSFNQTMKAALKGNKVVRVAEKDWLLLNYEKVGKAFWKGLVELRRAHENTLCCVEPHMRYLMQVVDRFLKMYNGFNNSCDLAKAMRRGSMRRPLFPQDAFERLLLFVQEHTCIDEILGMRFMQGEWVDDEDDSPDSSTESAMIIWGIDFGELYAGAARKELAKVIAGPHAFRPLEPPSQERQDLLVAIERGVGVIMAAIRHSKFFHIGEKIARGLDRFYDPFRISSCRFEFKKELNMIFEQVIWTIQNMTCIYGRRSTGELIRICCHPGPILELVERQTDWWMNPKLYPKK